MTATRSTDPSTDRGARSYGVKLVRGPFVRLAPHEDAVSTEKDLLALSRRLRNQDQKALIAADLFCGAGGLSLGLEAAGISPLFAVDHDAEAVETHRHHFPGLTVDWDLADPAVIERVGSILKRMRIDVLAGGPPCQPFSKAGRSYMRFLVKHGARPAHDKRRDLWQSFLDVVRLSTPRVVIMENVPDMALDREMFILRTMVLELERLGYAVEERVVDTWRYGVPQFRQRLILVAMRDGIRFAWPSEIARKTSVENAIGDLPAVEGGWRPAGGAEGWADYEEPITDFQRTMRGAVSSADAHKVFDHITRPVRPDDLRAFELMDTNTRYSQLPDKLKRYRDDIFDDKYKRLDAHDLSRTITAHIAKDGYWYIHPYQNRTLTVREAARLQTFPDQFRFAGPPSAAFRQIGNAVPPMFGTALGRAVVAALEQRKTGSVPTESIARSLANWFSGRELKGTPWLKATTRWQAIAAEILLERAATEQIRHLWPLVRRWKTPKETADAQEEVIRIGTWTGRIERADRLIKIAKSLSLTDALDDDTLAAAVNQKVLPQAAVDIAVLAVPADDEEPSEEPVIVNKGVLRVASRFTGEAVDRRNRLTDGRLAIARLIGFGETSRIAHLALMELSNTVCRPSGPSCTECPLAAWCVSSQVDDLVASRLPLEEALLVEAD